MTRNPATRSSVWRTLSAIFTAINVLAVALILIALGYAIVPFVRAVSKPKPVEMPKAMVEVDWHAPESSEFCLACHRQLSPAVAGLDVERGHSHNVPLNDAQIQAVHAMGTVVGPGSTLVCMSCHKLGQQNSPAMLADTLQGSRLCQQCHPGHYAQGTPHDLRVSAPDTTNRLNQTVAQGGPCSACHLSHSYARPIESSPLDPEGYCLPCHSKYGVAGGHARTTMDHPESRCRECHDPHDAANGEFLSEPIETLCLKCHEEYGGGVAGGTHPLGSMEKPVPQELIDAGANTMGNPMELTCVVCHDTHEAEHRSLLHLTPDANRLCLACHEEKLLSQSHAGVLPKHGQQPILNEQQRAVVASWGNPVGPNGELLCISCHRVHDAMPNTELLTFVPQYGDTCVACHPAEQTVFGTVHDLCTNFPDLPNTAGMTPIKAGACSACHLSHGFPRERAISDADPGGQCNTCHQPDSCAADKLAGEPSHPDTACIDCHDPHTRTTQNFLRSDETTLCVSCHADVATLNGGPHDITLKPSAWPADTLTTTGKCLPCHRPHGGDGPGLFRKVPTIPSNSADDNCLACHPNEGWDKNSTLAAIHPIELSADQHPASSLLIRTTDGVERIGCRTCHNPHGGAHPKNLARVAPDEPSEALCLSCHVEKDLIRLTGHSLISLQKAGFEIDSCKPCHAMHATSEGAWGELLSPRFLMDQCVSAGTDIGACVPCEACHRPDGPAPVRAVASHPEVLTMNVFQPEDAGYLPLFDKAGHVDPQGQITCRTCHVSHGRLDLLQRLEDRESLDDTERHQLKTQIRPFVPSNLCTTCHGDDARKLFLYFHDPERRGGKKS